MDSLIDLAALDTRKGADAGAALQLVHPKTGAPLPIRLTLLGVDSEAYQSALREQGRRRADQLARNRRARITPEEWEQESLELLASVTVGWTSFNLEGKEYVYSGAAAVALYRKFPWIREQADAFVQERANFLPESAKG